MAYPAFRSASTVATLTDAASVTFTKPTGLAVGDFMLVGIRIAAGTSLTITLPGGWTSLFDKGSNVRTYRIMSKVADSSDVAASDFTFNLSGTFDQVAGYMAAFSGVSSLQDSEFQELASGATSGSVTVDPLTDESLAVTTFLSYDSDLAAALTMSAQTLTPTTTLTERVDVGNRDGASDGVGAFLTSGEYAGTTQITGFSFTFSEAITGGNPAGVLILNGVQNAAADISHLAITPTIESVTGTNTATADVSHLAITPTIESLSANSTSDNTQWTSASKTSTTWTKQNKS